MYFKDVTAYVAVRRVHLNNFTLKPTRPSQKLRSTYQRHFNCQVQKLGTHIIVNVNKMAGFLENTEEISHFFKIMIEPRRSKAAAPTKKRILQKGIILTYYIELLGHPKV